MPILPIDAQTLFSQIEQVGKEQATQRESTPQAQSLQGAELARQAEQADHSVNQTRRPDEGAEKVRDGKEGGGRRKDRTRKKRAGRPAGDAAPVPEGEAERIADPDLGRHIDLLG